MDWLRSASGPSVCLVVARGLRPPGAAPNPRNACCPGSSRSDPGLPRRRGGDFPRVAFVDGGGGLGWQLAACDVRLSSTSCEPDDVADPSEGRDAGAELVDTITGRCRSVTTIRMTADEAQPGGHCTRTASGGGGRHCRCRIRRDFTKALVEAIGNGTELKTERGVLRFSATHAYPDSSKRRRVISPRRLSGLWGTNTTLRVGDKLFRSFYRRLQRGDEPRA